MGAVPPGPGSQPPRLVYTETSCCRGCGGRGRGPASGPGGRLGQSACSMQMRGRVTQRPAQAQAALPPATRLRPARKCGCGPPPSRPAPRPRARSPLGLLRPLRGRGSEIPDLAWSQDGGCCPDAPHREIIRVIIFCVYPPPVPHSLNPHSNPWRQLLLQFPRYRGTEVHRGLAALQSIQLVRGKVGILALVGFLASCHSTTDRLLDGQVPTCARPL